MYKHTQLLCVFNNSIYILLKMCSCVSLSDLGSLKTYGIAEFNGTSHTVQSHQQMRGSELYLSIIVEVSFSKTACLWFVDELQREV